MQSAWRLRGDLLREAGGDLSRAAADLSKAIELDPQDAEAYELRGVVYTNQRRLDRALADYDQAIKLKPDDAQAWSDRGVNYYLGGDNEKAIRDLSEALRLDPNRPRTYTNRGAAYKKLGQLDKAVADDGEAIRLDPKVPEYLRQSRPDARPRWASTTRRSPITTRRCAWRPGRTSSPTAAIPTSSRASSEPRSATTRLR